jgi:hypothetical protein
MSLITGRFQLSSEQKRFFDLINEYPTISGYWNVGARRCHEAELNNATAERSIFSLTHGD